MSSSASRLAEAGDTGVVTQRIQEDILRMLDTAFEHLVHSEFRLYPEEIGAEIDALARQAADQVQTYAQHWQQIAGEPVAEQGLWFTASDCYVSL